VREGVLHRLTDQPIRGGFGERAPAFQLSLDGRHVVAQFLLPGGATPASVRVVDLDVAASYRVTDLGSGAVHEASGEQLAWRGIPLDDEKGRLSSWLLLIEPTATTTSED
jgi:alpha-galactosidase